jgi:ubiquitin-protein ligase E3 A
LIQHIDLGIFTYNESTNLYWFNPNSLEVLTFANNICIFFDEYCPLQSPEEYRLVGILLGLAMYNNTILDLKFPSVVYKKLMGVKVGLHDLKDIDVDLVNGFETMLKYEVCSRSNSIL